MGLDGVEIAMEVEDAFGIKITDDEAQQIVTVGNLCDCVMAKVNAVDQPPTHSVCITARSFYRLRSGLVEGGVGRERMRPRSELRKLLPVSRRRRTWQELATLLGLELPALRRPALVSAAMTLLVFLVPLLAGIEATRHGLGRAYLALIATAITASVAGYIITVPTAVILPCETLGDLAYMVAWLNRGALHDNASVWTTGDVFLVVRKIIIQQLNIPPASVTREAKFVDDLGLD